jgi:D-alanyl-D-alanine carboxypeptidase
MLRVRSVEEDWTSGTGLGFDVKRVKGKTYIGHTGGYPGYATQTLIQLGDKVGIIVLTNTNDSNPADIAQQLMATVGDAVAKTAMTKPPTLAWDPAWERFAGLYRGLWGDRQVVLLNKKLAVIATNGPNLDDAVMLEPLGGGQFRFVAPTGGGGAYGVVGEIVRFVEQSERPTRMYVGDTWIDRVPEQ